MESSENLDKLALFKQEFYIALDKKILEQKEKGKQVRKLYSDEKYKQLMDEFSWLLVFFYKHFLW